MSAPLHAQNHSRRRGLTCAGDVPLVAGIVMGLMPAVAALVLDAAHRIGTRAPNNAWMWAIAAVAFGAIFAFDVPFPAIVFGARRWPLVFALGRTKLADAPSHGPTLIDDDTPPHARYVPVPSAAPLPCCPASTRARRRLLALAAAVALLRFKVGVMPLLAACALAGLLVRAAG